METGMSLYVPHSFRQFQGFSIRDIKEYSSTRHMEIVLEKTKDRTHHCSRCGSPLGTQKDRYYVRARHLRVMGWTVSVHFWREKRWCPHCRKTRSELIEWLCPTSPHMTLEMAWWINRLTEVTSVLAASRLEEVDKMTAYHLDHYILARMLQGYDIPEVRSISVDEVYARSRRQMKPGETRDDLFMTVITDQRTRKVLWVAQGRSQASLDQFFELLGPERSARIQVIATDGHDAYAASARQFAPQATVVLDRFHLVQNFNELLNDERKKEADRLDPEGRLGDLVKGKYKYVFLSKAKNRGSRDQAHIDEVMRHNARIAKMEMIKERFHQVFDCQDKLSAQVALAEVYEWSFQIDALPLVKWILKLMDKIEFWNYFDYPVTTSVSEGINRAIKGLKWQAYGYKNMAYFALKIMQKCGYLNHRFFFVGLQCG